MQVAEENHPSRQCKDPKHSACNEARACPLRSCVETFAEENAEEAAGNGAEQGYVSGLFQRHTQQQRYRKAESRLKYILAQDGPVQVRALCGCNEACHKQWSASHPAGVCRSA